MRPRYLFDRAGAAGAECADVGRDASGFPAISCGIRFFALARPTTSARSRSRPRTKIDDVARAARRPLFRRAPFSRAPARMKMSPLSAAISPATSRTTWSCRRRCVRRNRRDRASAGRRSPCRQEPVAEPVSEIADVSEICFLQDARMDEVRGLLARPSATGYGARPNVPRRDFNIWMFVGRPPADRERARFDLKCFRDCSFFHGKASKPAFEHCPRNRFGANFLS